ncbi:hypothetical protein D3C75_1010830 [compost metagenome]
MSGSIQQKIARISVYKLCLVGKHGNSARFFNLMGIQKGILMVHSAPAAYCLCMIKQLLGKSGFTGVDMREQSDGNIFHKIMLYTSMDMGGCFSLISLPL